jgi:hypothetical protein
MWEGMLTIEISSSFVSKVAFFSSYEGKTVLVFKGTVDDDNLLIGRVGGSNLMGEGGSASASVSDSSESDTSSSEVSVPRKAE